MLIKDLNSKCVGRFLMYIRNNTTKDTSWRKSETRQGNKRYTITVPSLQVSFSLELVGMGGIVSYITEDLMYRKRNVETLAKLVEKYVKK